MVWTAQHSTIRRQKQAIILSIKNILRSYGYDNKVLSGIYEESWNHGFPATLGKALSAIEGLRRTGDTTDKLGPAWNDYELGMVGYRDTNWATWCYGMDLFSSFTGTEKKKGIQWKRVMETRQTCILQGYPLCRF